MYLLHDNADLILASVSAWCCSMLFEDIVFPRYISTTSSDFIRALLNVSETNRLGYGINGLENVKAHPFFDDIEWEKLVMKHQVRTSLSIQSKSLDFVKET
jgi:hypothetical protein